ncbi:hypothetical protein EVAR_38036_1 [Eumeta japonica]|uniref:Integrase catalytic domain-containing protein n=1 Tax=Eumeta variegata TaxID=151549 RepID=A0A4C1W9T4_EUMVA|nr:hypothetical protein EVAR_38036_1 [Eumeta japonica]
MQKAMFILGVKQNLIPLDHPEANSMERKNRDLKTQLVMLVEEHHNRWPEVLPFIRFAMNTALTKATLKTPSYLTFGRELRSSITAQSDLRSVIEVENYRLQITSYLLKLVETLQSSKKSTERQQDLRKYLKDETLWDDSLIVGDLVLMKTHVLSGSAKGVNRKFVPVMVLILSAKSEAMAEAAAEEGDAALAEGRVNKNGIARIDVIADGRWEKKNWVCVHKYALEKLYFFGIIKNEPKLDGVASFNYGVLMATFQLHHQTLITIEYQSTRQDESNEPKLDGRLYRIHGLCVSDRAQAQAAHGTFPERGPGTNSLPYMKTFQGKVLVKRKALQEKLEEERKKGKIVFLKYGKLVVTENEFTKEKRKQETLSSPHSLDLQLKKTAKLYALQGQ